MARKRRKVEKTQSGKVRPKPIVCPTCGKPLIRMGHPNGGDDVVRYECSNCDTDVDIDMEGDVTVINHPKDERYRI